MEKIPYDIILEIQKKVNIVDIISSYIPLQKKGKNYFAVCPFHDDHNPSLSVSYEKQIYTCFVCGKSGNVFNFIMDYEKISFIEAVLLIARKININLNIKNDYINQNITSKYDKYYKMFELAKKFYQNNLKSSYGKKASLYLEKRNITKDAIKQFEIGLSFDDNNLSKFLISKNYLKEELDNYGLSGIKDNFTYDLFRNRIMFPLNDKDGNTIGFSGRIYNDEDDSKYVNSKESNIFKKGKLLYNYDKVSDFVKESNFIIVVEGFMDVIRLYLNGIKNVVATMGTAITHEHALLIRRLSNNVYLCFDGDKAGEKATISALKEFEKIDINPKIIRLEDNLDPDDYIIKNGKDAFLNHIKNPMSSLNFKIDIDKRNTDFSDFKDISKYVNSIAIELSKIDDELVYELTIKKICKETNLDYDTIDGLIKKNFKNNVEEKNIISIKNNKTYKNKYEKAEEYLIYYMLRRSDVINLYKSKVSYLNNKILSKIADEILDFYDKNQYINVTSFTVYLKDDTNLINETLKIDSLELDENVSIDVIDDYIKTIDEGILKKEIKKVKDLINNEENYQKRVKLLEKLAYLKKKECK